MLSLRTVFAVLITAIAVAAAPAVLPTTAHAEGDIPEVEREIVFVMDGTASMGDFCHWVWAPEEFPGPDPVGLKCVDNTLFELQRAGIARAINSIEPNPHFSRNLGSLFGSAAVAGSYSFGSLEGSRHIATHLTSV